jgi:hypothetical protein
MPQSMSREMSGCATFVESEQEMPEPETEDFFNETVQNSEKARKKEADLLSAELEGKPKKRKAKRQEKVI